ncbi:MAG: metal ABC transporter permease, partial [Okeania sp. SIO3B3]|nr:metal ABC transporter permease [Okeania sp. SIO3B3]
TGHARPGLGQQGLLAHVLGQERLSQGVSALVGTYVVLRGMALFGHALAHAVLPGVAVAYLIGGSNPLGLALGGLIAGIVTALGITAVSQQGVKEDSATGIIFISMFALGIALISTVRSCTTDLTHFLFGNVLGVGNSDLWLISGFGAVVVIVIALFYKEFQVMSFDPLLAKTLRLPTTLLNGLLLLLIAVTIVLALQVVGIALMSAMLVTPAATALLLTRRLPWVMSLSVLLGVLSGVIGLYLSFYINVASGPAIVLTSTALFLLALVFSPYRGLWRRLAQRLHNPTTRQAVPMHPAE